MPHVVTHWLNIYPHLSINAKWLEKSSKTVKTNKGDIEILTDIYAIEIDYAKNWAESIGQSLYYALISDKKPGILLIIENPVNENKYLKKIITVADEYGIKLWMIDTQYVVSIVN